MLLLHAFTEYIVEQSRPPDFFPRLMKQMLQALEYLDRRGVIHRDIKPDNILRDEAGNYYLADFGVSKFQNMTNTITGSLGYAAPEIFDTTIPQSPKMDIWSMGVLVLDVLDLLPPDPPWAGGEVRLGDSDWVASIVEHARAFVPQILPMLQEDPRKRFSAKECLEKIFNDEARVRNMRIVRSTRCPSSEPGSSRSTANRAGQGRDERSNVATGSPRPTVGVGSSARLVSGGAASASGSRARTAAAQRTSTVDSGDSHGTGHARRQQGQIRRENSSQQGSLSRGQATRPVQRGQVQEQLLRHDEGDRRTAAKDTRNDSGYFGDVESHWQPEPQIALPMAPRLGGNSGYLADMDSQIGSRNLPYLQARQQAQQHRTGRNLRTPTIQGRRSEEALPSLSLSESSSAGVRAQSQQSQHPGQLPRGPSPPTNGASSPAGSQRAGQNHSTEHPRRREAGQVQSTQRQRRQGAAQARPTQPQEGDQAQMRQSHLQLATQENSRKGCCVIS